MFIQNTHEPPLLVYVICGEYLLLWRKYWPLPSEDSGLGR